MVVEKFSMINSKDYLLKESNYYNLINNKNKIILANSGNIGLNHYYGWLKRYNGKYKKTAQYTVLRDGQIINHFDPKYCSDFMSNAIIDDSSIIILLENLGPLFIQDKKDLYYDWIGNIYDIELSGEIIEKKWRSLYYCQNYTTEQMDSVCYLVNNLCDDFQIPKIIVNSNIIMDKPIDFNGIMYRSNFEKFYTDLTPAWDFNNFNEIIMKKYGFNK